MTPQERHEIKETIELAIKPLMKTVESQGRTLFGEDGRNGMVADVNLLKDRQGRLIKLAWTAITGMVTAVGAALVNAWHTLNGQ